MYRFFSKCLSLLFILLLTSIAVSAQLPQALQPAVPLGIFPYKFEKKQPQTKLGVCFLLAPFLLNASPDSTPSRPYILDENGYLVWYLANPKGKMNSDFQYFAQAHCFSFMNILKDGSIHYILMDEKFEIIDSIRNAEPILADGHEFHILPNGHYLLGGKAYRTYNLKTEKFVTESPDNQTNVKAVAYVIQEFDKNKKLVFQWDSNDFLSPKEFVESYGFNAKEFDYCHGNAIVQDKNGDFWVSFRNFDALYKIDRKTGKILYKLGGKSNQFTFVNDKGFSGQHYVRILKNGNLSLYDNGTQSPEPKISRAVEYQIDTAKMTATKVWEWKENVFGKSLGSYHNFKGKYHLINYGYVFRPSTNITLVNAQNEAVANIIMKDSVMTYRAQLTDAHLFNNRPKVIIHKTKDFTELIAPDKCEKYLWSNGEKTRTIRVEKAGIYQVWIPQGAGMLGSLPIKIE